MSELQGPGPFCEDCGRHERESELDHSCSMASYCVDRAACKVFATLPDQKGDYIKGYRDGQARMAESRDKLVAELEAALYRRKGDYESVVVSLQQRAAELEATVAGLVACLEADQSRIAELQLAVATAAEMYSKLFGRSQELEATITRVRELPALWQGMHGYDAQAAARMCADELEAALAPPGKTT